ncbi:unnamed protein product [Tilletia laevis]|uniref:Uncharacterized protein n=2 Tax=Tilletia TaxID=13289 RepID=A0A8X7MNT2_9BASI|nr:hypothetical protein CF335_g7351 [Tilletia laevis]KAE8189797.1 hypothetical protein CF328_g6170 [Tilletia controversa]KAE8238626.1 hypothetical protein A4X03_0g8818 [Tilletia caries]KAE8242431.1 hypothetical protein A4X06_0g6916 [Tilletia controversa]CAD6884488.1 unnamed protein product [Tilletia caries]
MVQHHLCQLPNPTGTYGQAWISWLRSPHQTEINSGSHLCYLWVQAPTRDGRQRAKSSLDLLAQIGGVGRHHPPMGAFKQQMSASAHRAAAAAAVANVLAALKGPGGSMHEQVSRCAWRTSSLYEYCGGRADDVAYTRMHVHAAGNLHQTPTSSHGLCIPELCETHAFFADSVPDLLHSYVLVYLVH